MTDPDEAAPYLDEDDDCDDPCPDCGHAYCLCYDDRTDHDRGVCMGPGCCKDCDTPPPWYIREWRRQKPQHGSRNARRRLQATRNLQADRRTQRTNARRTRDLGCCSCPGGWTVDCACIPF